MSLRQIFDRLFGGIETAREGKRANWGIHHELNRIDPGFESGYVSVGVAGYFSNVDRQALNNGLPMLAGEISLTPAGATTPSASRLLVASVTNLPSVSADGFVLAPDILLFKIPYSNALLDIKLALNLVPTGNLVKETIGLISAVTAQIPVAQASLPFLSIANAAADALNSVLSLGTHDSMLAGHAGLGLEPDKFLPSQVVWIAANADQSEPERIQWISGRGLTVEDQPYKASPWIVLELTYSQSFGDVRSIPEYIKCYDILLDAVKGKTTPEDIKNALNEALRECRSVILHIDMLTVDDRSKLLTHIRGVAGELYSDATQGAFDAGLAPLIAHEALPAGSTETQRGSLASRITDARRKQVDLTKITPSEFEPIK